MSKNNENDIEKLFQKASEEYQEAFEEKDWHKMEAMLDKEAKHVAAMRAKKLKRLALLLIGLLLLTGSGYLLSSRMNKQQKSFLRKDKNVHAKSIPLKKNLSEAKEDKDRLAERPDEVSIEKERALPHEEDPAVFRNIQETDASPKQTLPLQESLPKADQKTPSEATAIKQNWGNIKGQKQPLQKALKQIRSEQIQELSRLHRKNLSLEKNGRIAGASEKPEDASLLRISKSDTIQAPQAVDSHSLTVTQVLKDSLTADTVSISESSSLRWSITVAVGPDLSAMKLDKYTTPGYSFGLIVHYHISDQWQVGIGVLKSTKKYLGEGSEYHPPKKYWKYYTNGVIPENIAGKCALLEVPIIIRYQAINAKKNSFYLSGGISSYFMLSESYQYAFSLPNQEASRGWRSSEAAGSHLFNIVNFSIGYERTLSRRFAVGVEPYIKVPIEGIGWAEVKFFSLGTYVTLRYNLGSN